MPETECLIEFSGGFELEFVERGATPEPAMNLGIQLHAAGLSLSDTVSVLAGLGVDRCRSTVHIGCTNPVYSRPAARTRITLRLTRL